MFGLIKDVGDFVGLFSFLVMAALLVLYLVRARELRGLRRSAPFLVNAGNGRGNARSRRAAARAGRRRSRNR